MLRETNALAVKRREVTREDGYVVIAMRRYPRYIRKEWRDEYRPELSPSAELLDGFLEAREDVGDHDEAIEACRYEERFELSDEGVEHLARLSERAEEEDVWLVCQCGPDQRCHRDLLLILARELFGAGTAEPRFAYPTFEERVKEMGAPGA